MRGAFAGGGEDELIGSISCLGHIAHEVDIPVLERGQTVRQIIVGDELDVPVRISGQGVDVLDVVAAIVPIVVHVHVAAVVEIADLDDGVRRGLGRLRFVGVRRTRRSKGQKPHDGQRQDDKCDERPECAGSICAVMFPGQDLLPPMHKAVRGSIVANRLDSDHQHD